MADDGDRAKAISARHVANMLADRAANRPTGESSTHCEECGSPIPEKRRIAAKGCTRCAECQAETEELERRSL